MKNVLMLLVIVLTLCIGCSVKPILPPKTIPSIYANDNEIFVSSITLLNEARRLSSPEGNPGAYNLDTQTEDLIYSKTAEGIRLGKLVSSEYLDYVHPELKDMFRDKLLKGSEIWYKGIRDNNAGNEAEGVQEQLEGADLTGQWNDWWNINGNYIADTVIPR